MKPILSEEPKMSESVFAESGRRIKALRESMGVEQSFIAARITHRMPPGYNGLLNLASWENGNEPSRYLTLVGVCAEIFCVPAEQITGAEHERCANPDCEKCNPIITCESCKAIIYNFDPFVQKDGMNWHRECYFGASGREVATKEGLPLQNEPVAKPEDGVLIPQSLADYAFREQTPFHLVMRLKAVQEDLFTGVKMDADRWSILLKGVQHNGDIPF